ncbi:hypothetical protein BDW74DRAFT_179500 [Aspergillus multicolor]|uniref:uncharacterized protein n=1 Tax=Aspergillus multicolor TaxID=41759 RepID=UPI003CCCA414
MVKPASSLDLDPAHKSCIGGRTVLTCRSCAGNAPRTTVCSTCSGAGFNIFVCAHCNPAAAVNSHISAATSSSSTPASLSRSSSTSVSSYNDRLASNTRNGGSGSGRVENNPPRSHK